MVRETQAAPQRCLFENRSRTMNIVIEKSVMVPMRDGVNLATDIYRPAQEGQFPVLLSCLPYNKELPGMLASLAGTALRAAQHACVSALQDCRGRAASAGGFSP